MSTPSLRPPGRSPVRAAISESAGPHDLSDPGSGAAWSIISYVLSGILFWGVLGRLLDNWVFDPEGTTTVFLPMGVLVGTAAGGYLGYMRYLQAIGGRDTPLTNPPE